ncbi:LytTR family DNA-binding domain-containing protein [Eubacterium sp. 1001713B170207_170306_E7]|uniref:LytR/AlgR family response regulator transcription factor n=1 Tax=Eubacterium sp. 1001713B170207_170306_E7 TaxID=2787097 RepID=UPI001897F6AF|nr:LytTR family DNA-binding domain-containing protein [Eubacterium sp. 1001713B170207_170306_E7]
MYRIAVVDDDESFLNQLCSKMETILCEKGLVTNSDFSIDRFTQAGEIQSAVLENPSYYHLLLLDIELSKENGLALARGLREQDIRCSIIYITAYRDYVFDCFDTQPLWYLMKPLDYDKFTEILLSDYRRSYADTRLVLKIDGRKVPLSFHDIYALEAAQHRTRIWLHEGYRNWNGALSTLKQQLPSSGFCHSHNSYIINLSHVKEIQRTDVLMDNGKTFPVSRRYYNQTFEKYFTFLKL